MNAYVLLYLCCLLAISLVHSFIPFPLSGPPAPLLLRSISESTVAGAAVEGVDTKLSRDRYYATNRFKVRRGKAAKFEKVR